MKAAVLEAYGRMVVRDVARPEVGPDEALVRVGFAGICGTDLHLWKGEHPTAVVPVVPGHEFAGTLAAACGALPAGTPVVVYPLLTCQTCRACREGLSHVCENLRVLGVHQDGAFAEYVKVPAANLLPLPAGLALRDAALIEPVAVAVHVVSRSPLRVGDTVLVIGAGPIGLLVGLVARLQGAAQVCISEVNPHRLRLAKDLGFVAIDSAAADVAREVRGMTDGAGADVVFETAGVPPAAAQMVKAVRGRGTIVLVGIHGAPAPLDLTGCVLSELTLIGSRVYTRVDYARAVRLVASGQVKGDGLVTGVLELAEIPRGFASLMTPGSPEVKVLVDLQR